MVSVAHRPPTPPKDHDTDHDLDQALHFLVDDDDDITQDELPPAAAGTPVQPSPPSSQETGSRSRPVKRVEFSPCVTTHDPPPAYPTATASPIPRRFPSSKQPNPLRSILRTSAALQTPTPDGAASPASDYFSISDPKTFPIMLDSVIKFLDSSDTAMRLDGYTTLNGALKAYDDLPDVDALKSKMPLLVRFMARDVSESARKTGPMESQLPTQALKLATAILMTPALEDSLDEHFQTLLVDRAIDVLEQDPVPKAIANHHMYLLATQRFSSRIVSATKAERIVSSLVTVHERVTGNSVIASRLVIFQRLLEQAQSTMLNTVRDWLPHVFHGVLSSIKDIRGRATETGVQAAMSLGTYYQATKAIVDLFNTSTSEGGIYGNYFTARLFDMVSSPDLAEYVPQIWSMVILFFRSRKLKLGQWRFTKELLGIIEKGLNHKDIAVKFRSTCAWNRLVYVVYPDHETREKMEGFAHTLRLPFMVAFSNKAHTKSGKEARQIALSGYCNLLHYALRPSQPHEDLDYYWDFYVHQILSKLLRAGGRDANMACRVLRALFDGKSLVWDENLANKAPILPEALPRLDPKWVRSRAGIILELLAPCVELSLSQPENGRGIAGTPWREFMTAIAGAGSQEIRESLELKECLAHLMNFFGRLWANASKSLKVQTEGSWVSRFSSFVQCSIEILGPLHFGEENLTRNQTREFEAAPTPSHRMSKHHEVLQSSAVFLFGLFNQPPVSIDTDADYFDAVKGILNQICQGKQSRKWRLEIIRKCTQASASGPARLWTVALQEAIDVLVDSNLDESIQEPQRLAHQARHAVSILLSGLYHDDVDPDSLSTAFELMSVLAKILKQETGEGGVVLGLMEPVADSLSQKTDKTMPRLVYIQCATKLLQEGTFPRNRRQIDEARKILWNVNPTHSRQGVFEPFDWVYEVIKTTFAMAYENATESPLPLAGFSEATQGFLLKCPPSLYGGVLRKIQSGISQVIKDSGRVLAGNQDAISTALKILALWQAVLGHLKNIPLNGNVLKALDELLAAGLNSTHRDVINATVSFWNETFGRLDSLEYPANIEQAIRRIRPLVDLDLPSFPERSHEPEPSPLHDFVESQEEVDSEVMPTPTKQPVHKKVSKISALSRALSASPRREKVTASKKPYNNAASKAKLRHNDSQMEFTEVESSPHAMESQLMTEHQKEVRSRQQNATALYADSSSPPRPTTSELGLPKLDLLKRATGVSTPTLEHGPMDEFITSSPTPKASEKNQAPAARNADDPDSEMQDHLPEADDADIPSSPPQYDENDLQDEHLEGSEADRVVAETVPPVEDAETLKAELANHGLCQQTESAHLKSHPAFRHLRQDLETGTSSDLYTDARSQFEETTKIDDLAVDDNSAEGNDRANDDHRPDGSDDSSPIRFTDSFAEAEGQSFRDQTTIGEEESNNEAAKDDHSRIADSFAGPVTGGDDVDADTTAKESTRNKLQTTADSASQPNTPASRSKRKRDGETERKSPTKRRKSNSPLKRIISFFKPADEDDEEIEDCIVVGSQAEENAMPPPESPRDTTVPASVEPARFKRGRGRPRKSGTPVTSSPASSTKPRTAKRRASTLEDEEVGLSQASVVADTPAPSKSRRITRSQDVKSGQLFAPQTLPPNRRTSRKLEAVVIPTSNRDEASQADSQEGDEEANHEANSQLKLEEEAAAAAIRNRPIAKPKSIIERLRGIISDCRTLMLGSQEERDIQDVMFELGKEVFEARKRSRESD